MSIAMACPYCYKELEFDAAEAGKETECPFCHRAIMVDGAEPPEVRTGPADCVRIMDDGR